MWYVYGLKCRDNSLYVGSTNSVKRRVAEHQSGLTQSTKSKLPVRLVFHTGVHTEKGARALEKYLKTGSGEAVLKKRILADEAS
ncbi:MAG: GIY-YIG nuclease family protein [Patescibacteria group bacterium]